MVVQKCKWTNKIAMHAGGFKTLVLAASIQKERQLLFSKCALKRHRTSSSVHTRAAAEAC